MLDSKTFYDRVYAGWMGKNIGGTLGGPLEGIMELLDVKDYTQEFLGPVENDDLDLQLVALHCLEQYGGLMTTELLSEEWKSHVFFEYDEYGHALTNIRKGVGAPLSGIYNNFFTDCMGSPIRSELWGMVCAGLPDLAAYYAYHDASVDHAGGEGMYGEIFFAVFESLAFECDDIDYLIEKSLSYLPKECMVSQNVRHLLSCKDKGMSWKDARQSLIDHFAGENFTYAPLNIAFTLVGLLWEEGFTDRLLATTNCGYDTDCTCATIASMMGILYGSAYLDEQWTKPLGENIRVSEAVKGFRAPETIRELTERTLRMRELVSAHYHTADPSAFVIPYETYVEHRTIPEKSVTECDLAITITYEDHHPAIAPLQEKRVFLALKNQLTIPYEGRISLQSPKGFEADGEEALCIAPGESKNVVFTVKAPREKQAVYPFFIVVSRTLKGVDWTNYRLPFVLLPTLSFTVTKNGIGFGKEYPDNCLNTEKLSGLFVGETKLVVPSEQEGTLILTCREPVRLWLDGELVVCCEEQTAVIPAYHRSDRRKCHSAKLPAGRHSIRIEADSPEKLYFYWVSNLYWAAHGDCTME